MVMAQCTVDRISVVAGSKYESTLLGMDVVDELVLENELCQSIAFKLQ
jgi:hypothetical protein